VPLPLAAPPRDDRPLERLVVVVAGPGGARPRLHQYALHDDPRQEIRGDTLIVSRRGRADERPADPRRHLAPDPLVPSDDPAIRAAARALVAPRPEETAARIVRWVDREVVRAPSDRVVLPDAAGALRRGRGTDQERLLVMVALARAAGIPARTVGGLLLRGDRFHWHAWAELHLDGWVPADPYTGQLPADAARVRLVVGGLGRPAELFPLFGGMRLRVVERRETR
ncbi:MAG TPA: transglutaminase-like domain-containing protein, partial [Gemmatimonadales bacterium]|nr:transglutaminase-like domain-containing protein [Gemmatimonadales bacterium]